jgi:acetoin:2,6-dichlorophenolindophenol oxidoreductase subunit beta
MSEITYGKAFTQALTQTMREDPDVFVIGEDVAGYGGVFHMFDGLLDEFGPERVHDTPIAEAGIVGLGVGAAASGLRPVVDLMFMDFMGIAMDQIANQAAKLKFMFGGGARVPLTLTTAYGAGLGASGQHSQSLEAWLVHIPGLKVVMPATAVEAKGLTLSAIRDDNPVVVMLHKRLLGAKAEVPDDLGAIPLGVAEVKRAGSDVTVVATGRMVGEALIAAETLAGEGIDAEVIDPRTVQPLDAETIIESVRRTNHAVVVHEAVEFGGIGAEIVAQIQNEAFDYLDAPIARVAAPFSPVPFSPVLEQAYLPDPTRIAEAIRGVRARAAV